MSQDSREKFGVKTQISIGWGGGGGEGGKKARKERKDIMLKAGQSRGSIVCVNGIMHYKTWWFLIKRFPWTK